MITSPAFLRRKRSMLSAWRQRLSLLLLCLLTAGAVNAQTLYAVTGSGGGPSTLYTLNAGTGAVIATIGATGHNHVTGLAMDPTTGVMYAHDNNTGALLTIDLGTGAATVVGNTGHQIPDMAFAPNGTLYAWSENTDDLYTVNKNTGALTLVGSCFCGTARTGLAITASGDIYMKSYNTINLMNAANGQVVSSASYGTLLHNILSCNSSGVLYSGQRSGGVFSLYTITPTGATSLVGSNAIGNISSIEFSTCQGPAFTTCPSNMVAGTSAVTCDTFINIPVAPSGTPDAVNYSFSGATTGGGSGTTISSNFNRGVTHVSITARYGTCFSYCTFTVTVNDNTPPTLNMPGNITVPYQVGTCGATVTYATPTVSDNCPGCGGNTPSGYTSIGTYGNSRYFVSNAPDTWDNQNAAAQAAGGHLATISSAGENAFLSGSVSGLAWIGFTDRLVEGTYVWENGEPVVYTNWCPFEPNDLNGEDHTVINWCNNGSWNDLGDFDVIQAILEYECAPTLISGLPSGSVFPVGTTTVTYSATDAYGNIGTGSFTVTVTPPTCNITVTPSNTTYTGGVPTNIYLGYGPQSATLTAVPAAGETVTSYSWSPAAGLSSTSIANPVFTPTTAGNYTFTVTITYASGCTSTCSISFCVLDIRVPGQAGKVYICHAPPDNPTNVQTLSISVSAVPSHIPFHAGDHLGTCSQSCNSNARMLPGAGAGTNTVAVYPNPNKGSFTVELPYVADGAQIVVMDASGRTVAKRTVSQDDVNKINMKLEGASAGVYFIEVTYDDQQFRSKLVIQ